MGDNDRDGAARAKQEIAGTFDRAAGDYDQVWPRFFSALGRKLVELAGIPAGARVLDVVCGRGALLFPAAELAGPHGRVAGIDLAEGMMRPTAAEVARRGLPGATLELMDAERLAFADGCFDYVLCGFAIFFCPRPQVALAEFARVLAPGGRLALSTWGGADQRWTWLIDLLRAYLPPAPEAALEAPPEAPSPSASAGPPAPDYRDPASLRAFLAGAGFTEIATQREDREIVYADEEEWSGVVWSHSGRHDLETIRDTAGLPALARFKAEAGARMQAYRQADGYHQSLVALLNVGRKRPA